MSRAGATTNAMIGVAVVDSGGANLGSVLQALSRLGAAATLTRDPDAILAAERVLLPGVGAAAPAMQRLLADGLDQVLRQVRQPLLGICLGMQLLYERSEEGDCACLGLLPGTVRRMQPAAGVRIPHMGWNALRQERRDAPLLRGIDDGEHMYFVHSYAAPVDAHCVASCDHGTAFAAVVQRGHLHGAQFHPERSGAAGAALLRNFIQQPA